MSDNKNFWLLFAANFYINIIEMQYVDNSTLKSAEHSLKTISNLMYM